MFVSNYHLLPSIVVVFVIVLLLLLLLLSLELAEVCLLCGARIL